MFNCIWSLICSLFLETLIVKCCRLYNVFGSGACHGAHAKFIAQSSIANRGRRVGLLCGVRHKDSLKSTIHTLKFGDLVKNDKTRSAVMDIENEVFNAFYSLLHDVFPAICALHFTDSNRSMMDKIYFFCHTKTALRKSIAFLNDTEVFGAFTKGDDTLEDEIGEA